MTKLKKGPMCFLLNEFRLLHYILQTAKKAFLIIKNIMYCTYDAARYLWKKKKQFSNPRQKIKKQKLGRQIFSRKTAFDYFSKDIIESNFFFVYNNLCRILIIHAFWALLFEWQFERHIEWESVTLTDLNFAIHKNIHNSIYLFVK